MSKWLDRAIGAFLQVSAGALCYISGSMFIADDVAVLLLLPAAGLGASGLALWSRAGRSARVGKEPEQLDTQVAQLRELISSMQVDMSQLREERDFLRDLNSGSSTRVLAERGAS